MITRSLTGLIYATFITICTQTAFAESISPQETDLITKEDIAATQVLAEVCPAVQGNHPIFQSKIDLITQTLLKRLSKTTTLSQLQQDSEYQSVLSAARKDSKEVDQTEQKSACKDIIDFE